MDDQHRWDTLSLFKIFSNGHFFLPCRYTRQQSREGAHPIIEHFIETMRIRETIVFPAELTKTQKEVLALLEVPIAAYQ